MLNRTLLRKALPAALAGAVLIALVALSPAGEPGQAGRVKVTFKDGKVVTGEPALPLDPTPRIRIQHSGGFAFGLNVDGNRICCSDQGSIWSVLRVDGQEYQLSWGQMPGTQAPTALKPLANGKPRNGFETVFTNNDIRVTQIIEAVPGIPAAKKNQPGEKRRLDTARMTHVVENLAKDGKARKVEYKVCIDMLIADNDGALYASPTTHPGKVLNGMQLSGKAMPAYVQCLQRPDVANPGFVATMTFKNSGRGDGPNTFVMTNLGVVSQGWIPPAQQAGDSACAIIWDAKDVPAGGKREMVWGYGGGLASDPDNEGKVSVSLGGNFEPGKLFTIHANVDDPAANQVLTLELPQGMERVEGREIQPVPVPGDSGNSVVMWKARVQRMGDYEIRVRSSTGVTQIKHVSIQPE